jgi:hypothetical protein
MSNDIRRTAQLKFVACKVTLKAKTALGKISVFAISDARDRIALNHSKTTYPPSVASIGPMTRRE